MQEGRELLGQATDADPDHHCTVRLMPFAAAVAAAADEDADDADISTAKHGESLCAA